MDTETVSILANVAKLDWEQKQWLAQAMEAQKVFSALDDIHERVWRPSWKHGYGGKLGELIEAQYNECEGAPGVNTNCILEAIELLRGMYYEILDAHSVVRE